MKELEELKDLADATIIIFKPGASLSRITEEDIKRDPSLLMVRRMAKWTYAIQLSHIQSRMKGVADNPDLLPDQKAELIKELEAEFSRVKTECLYCYPEKGMGTSPEGQAALRMIKQRNK